MSRNQMAEMYEIDKCLAGNAREIAKINADAAVLHTYRRFDIEQSKQTKLVDRIIKNMLKLKDKTECAYVDNGFLVCPYANNVSSNGVAYNEETGLLQLAYKSDSPTNNVFTKPVKFLTRSEINAKLNPEVIETTMLEISKSNSSNNYWNRRFGRGTAKYTPNRFAKIVENIYDSLELGDSYYHFPTKTLKELYAASPDAYEIFSKTPAIVYLIMEQMLGTKTRSVINQMPEVTNPYSEDNIKTVIDMVKFIEAQELSEFDICGKDVNGNSRPVMDTITAVQYGYLNALLLFADLSGFEEICYRPYSYSGGFRLIHKSEPLMLESIKVPTVDSLLNLKTAIDELGLKESVNWNSDFVYMPKSFENPVDSDSSNAILRIYQVLKAANIQYEVIDIEPVDVQFNYNPAGYTQDAIEYIKEKDDKQNLCTKRGVGFKKDIATAYNAIKLAAGKSDYIGRLFTSFVSDDYEPSFKYDGYIRKPVNDVVTKDDVLRAMDAIEAYTTQYFGHSHYRIMDEIKAGDDTRLAAFAEAMYVAFRYRTCDDVIYSVEFDKTSDDITQLFVDYVNYIYKTVAVYDEGSGIAYSCNRTDHYYDYRTKTVNFPFTRDDAIAFSVMICVGKRYRMQNPFSFVKITEYDESKIIDM